MGPSLSPRESGRKPLSPLGYLVAEWRIWREERSHLGLLLALLAIGLASSLTWLGPFALSLTLPGAALLLGWASGSRYRPGQRFRKLLLGSPLAPGGAALGKALASLAEGGYTLLLLAPPALLALALWDRGSLAALLLLVSLGGAFLLSAAAGFLSSLLLGGEDRLLGLYFFGAWLPLCGLLEILRPFLPFAQAWAALGAPPSSPWPLLFASTLEVLLALLLFALGGPAILAARRRDAAS